MRKKIIEIMFIWILFGTITLIIPFYLVKCQAATLSATTRSEAYPVLAYAGQTAYLTCQHSVNVVNPGASETVYITYQLCATNKGCQTKTYHVLVDAAGYTNIDQLHIYPIYNNRGRYELTCKTSVTYGQNYKLLAEHQAQNYIQIN